MKRQKRALDESNVLMSIRLSDTLPSLTKKKSAKRVSKLAVPHFELAAGKYLFFLL